MKLSKFLGTIAGVACVGLAVPASATILTATYTGTVSYTHNQYGTATPLGTDLSGLVGQTFTARYVYDTDLGTRNTYDSGGYSYDQVYGGSLNGNTNPILSALITFGTTTTNFSSSVYGGQYVQTYYGTDYTGSWNYPNYSCSSACAYTALQNYSYLPAGTIASPASLENPFSWHSSQGGGAYGYIQGYVNDGYNETANWYVQLNTTTIDVTLGDTTSVPEPSSLALLGLGLAGLGFARRRKV